MSMDRRTIRTAIQRRCPEIFHILIRPHSPEELKEHPGYEDKMMLYCLADVPEGAADMPLIAIEQQFRYQGSHDELLNAIDEIAEEIKKVRRRNKTIETWAKTTGNKQDGMKVTPGGIIVEH